MGEPPNFAEELYINHTRYEYDWHSFGSCYIKSEGNPVETSHGASLPFSDRKQVTAMVHRQVCDRRSCRLG
ncbi:MAG: hypothetical protein F6J92_33085 [Symploca sp. SIO1A3]|nr:hypothetical protein [Symploca sp. SIO2C1]NER51417.1 hypothetical protein [Symploca sp. SIO1A3]